jgi:hypothetical protein
MNLITKEEEEEEISEQLTFLFPHFYFSEDQRVSNENENISENENEIENEIEKIPHIQEEENKIPQTQEEMEEGIKEIFLRMSNRIPQASIRLRDFITYKVHYSI